MRFRLWLARKLAPKQYMVVLDTPCLTVEPGGELTMRKVIVGHGSTLMASTGRGNDWTITGTAGTDCP